MYYISSFFLFFFLFFKDDCQRLVGGAGASLLTGAIHFVIFRRPESFFFCPERWNYFFVLDLFSPCVRASGRGRITNWQRTNHEEANGNKDRDGRDEEAQWHHTRRRRRRRRKKKDKKKRKE